MRCIIIEDEIPAQKIILHYINKLPDLEVVNVFNSAIEANRFLNQNTVDLLFLDINLPDISGIDYIKTVKNPPAVIMTTAYPDYAVDSFELPTIVDYLVKPFSFDRFLKAINKAERFVVTDYHSKQEESINNDTLYLNIDKTLHKIHLKDIKYIVSEKNYVTVVTTKKRYSYLEALKNLEAKLANELFLRTHKSYIINSSFIDKISGNIVIIDGEKIPIGRTYKKDLFDKLNLG